MRDYEGTMRFEKSVYLSAIKRKTQLRGERGGEQAGEGGGY